MNSPRRVEDPNDADIIFVYDYCRLMCAHPHPCMPIAEDSHPMRMHLQRSSSRVRQDCQQLSMLASWYDCQSCLFARALQGGARQAR